jgi:hypothetical protein
MVIYEILINASILSLVLPISAGIYKLKVLGRDIRLLLVYLIIAFVIAAGIIWFIKNYSAKMTLSHINVLIEYIFIMFIIISWQESQRMHKLFTILFLFFVAFWVFAKLTFEPISGLFSITSSISQSILALCAGYTLFVVIENHEQPLLHHQRFWLLLAFVLNYTGTLMPIALVGIIPKESAEVSSAIWSISWVLIIFTNILFTIGFLCPQTRQS